MAAVAVRDHAEAEARPNCSGASSGSRETGEDRAAQTELTQARASYAQTKPRAEKLEKRSLVASEKLDAQRSEVEGLRSKVDTQHQEAENLRQEHIDERENAAERIDVLEVSNETAQEDFEATRLGTVYLGGLFAGFLLFSIANLIAAAITSLAWRLVLGATGLFGSLTLFGIGLSVGSFGVGFVLALLGGLLLSFVLMVARAWLFAAKMSATVAITFATVAGLVAIAAIASGATSTAPPAEQPAKADQALVEEAETDPAAAELEEAQVAEAAAEELEPEVEELETDLADLEAKVEALTEKTDNAQTKAETDAKAIESAKDELSSLS